MDRVVNLPKLDGWMPIRLRWREEQPFVDWCYFGPERFSDPFFNQTVEARLRRPFSLLFRHETSIDTLGHLERTTPGLTPTGFIFHMSRCGSTLVAQVLGTLLHSIVISEAPLIDSVIRANLRSPRVNIDQRIEWLRGLVSVMGRPLIGGEKSYFIKFDAWHILDLPLIRQAFPNVPWIFLYRDPNEVLVSQLERPSTYMLPAPMNPSAVFTGEALPSNNLTDHFAQVLMRVCEAGLRYSKLGGRLINYRQLPDAVWSSVLDLFKTSASQPELENMKSAARLHAKNPFVPFEGDSSRKQEKATREILDAAQKWVYPVYEQLETARLAQVTNEPQ